MRAFIVSADHPVDRYRLHHQPVRIGESPHGREFWASRRPFGCGKSAETPEGAIHLLLRDNGCTNIRVHGEQARVGPNQMAIGDTLHLQSPRARASKIISKVWYDSADGYYVGFTDGTNFKENVDTTTTFELERNDQ